MDPTFQLLHGDCRATLATLPDASVQCCVTSPPYWGLRDYGTPDQIGLESTPDAYVAELVAVFREVRRVLKYDGVCWLNLGDSYAGYWGDQKARDENRASSADTNGWTNGFNMNARPQFDHLRKAGLKPKDLVGIPWRVAFALQADGWWLRSDVIWAKPNPMPESVTDRPTKAHEYVFLLAKAERYYYDAEAIAEASVGTNAHDLTGQGYKAPGQSAHTGSRGRMDLVKDTRNARTVWTIATQPYRDAHFAVMPEALATRCILAGSRVGDTILDPFAGAGTTGVAALGNGRSFIGCEANAAYVDMARRRLQGVAPLFAVEQAG